MFGLKKKAQPSASPAPDSATVRDPVCGMHIRPESAAGHMEYAGKQYYFCNPGCRQKFKQNPAQFVKTT